MGEAADVDGATEAGATAMASMASPPTTEVVLMAVQLLEVAALVLRQRRWCRRAVCLSCWGPSRAAMKLTLSSLHGPVMVVVPPVRR